MTIRQFTYSADHYQEHSGRSIVECLTTVPPKQFTWIDIDGKLSGDTLAPLMQQLQLHQLVAEDILDQGKRPKVVFFEHYLFMLLRMIYPAAGAKAFTSEQISLLMSSHFIISFQAGDKGDVFTSVRDNLRTGKGLVRHQGIDFLLYELINAVVDNYFTVLEKLDEKVESLEDDMIKTPQPTTVRRLHNLKRDLAYLRKSVWPMREVIGDLERGTSPLIQQGTSIYLRDVYDHTIQIIDTIETLRDILAGMVDIYLSAVNNRLNAVIKVLTIITTIFMPLTLVVGIFGMNFSYLPGLDSPMGPALVLAGLGVIAGTMLLLFRWRRWL